MELPDHFRHDIQDWRRYRVEAKKALEAFNTFDTETTLDSEAARKEFAKLEEEKNRTESLVRDTESEICMGLAKLYVNN